MKANDGERQGAVIGFNVPDTAVAGSSVLGGALIRLDVLGTDVKGSIVLRTVMTGFVVPGTAVEASIVLGALVGGTEVLGLEVRVLGAAVVASGVLGGAGVVICGFGGELGVNVVTAVVGSIVVGRAVDGCNVLGAMVEGCAVVGSVVEGACVDGCSVVNAWPARHKHRSSRPISRHGQIVSPLVVLMRHAPPMSLSGP